eukprot:g9779.t1
MPIFSSAGGRALLAYAFGQALPGSSSPALPLPRPVNIIAAPSRGFAFAPPAIRNWDGGVPAEAHADADVVAQAVLRGWLTDSHPVWQQLPETLEEQRLPLALAAAVRSAEAQDHSARALQDMTIWWRNLHSTSPQLRQQLLRHPEFVAAALSVGIHARGFFRSVGEVQGALPLDSSVRDHPAVIAAGLRAHSDFLEGQEDALRTFGITSWERDVPDAAKNDPDVVVAALEMVNPLVTETGMESNLVDQGAVPAHLRGHLISDPRAQVPQHLWQDPAVVYALLTTEGSGAHGLKYGGEDQDHDEHDNGTEDEELASQETTHCQHIGWVSSWEDVPVQIRGDESVAWTGIACGWVTDFWNQVPEPAKSNENVLEFAHDEGVLHGHGWWGAISKTDVGSASEEDLERAGVVGKEK